METIRKNCRICKISKNIKEYYVNKRTNKHLSICKNCDNKRRVKHQQENREKYNKKQKSWTENNKERSREIKGRWAVNSYRRVRLEALLVVGNNKLKCVRCRFDDVRALCIDHINGGGVKHFSNSSSAEAYYKDMIKEPSKYQLLCANCNQIKRYENKERCSKYVSQQGR